MSLNTAVMFGKASDEWQTPVETFNALNAEFGFDMDAAATDENRWVDGGYFGPDHTLPDQRDALAVNWRLYGKTFWLNPPYSKCREFIAKAALEARRGATVVCLVPSRTDTQWWHLHVWDVSMDACRPGVEVRFVKGRLRFAMPTGEPIRKSLRNGPGSAPNNSAPFPSVVVIFRPPCQQGALDLFTDGRPQQWSLDAVAKGLAKARWISFQGRQDDSSPSATGACRP